MLAGFLKSENFPPHGLRKLDEGKLPLVEKVVVPALVDDPYEILKSRFPLYPRLSIRKPYGCDALQLSPPATSVRLSKKRPHVDAPTGRDRFNLLDLADDLEFHSPILSENLWAINASNDRVSAAAAQDRTAAVGCKRC